jgi:hypothetical protein
VAIRFFFDDTNRTIQERYKNIFKDGQRTGNRHADENWDIMSGFGWLNTLYDLAFDGVFTSKNQSAIVSVQESNLYDVLTFLSWKSAKNEYESEVRSSMESEAESRQRSKR